MQFRILGPLEVEDGGEPLVLAGAKQRALLALLLLRANQVVSRDTLIDGLWGESPPRDADHSLEAHVSRLRKLLHRNGQDLIATSPGGYALRLGDGGFDLAEFERLADQGRAALREGREERAAALLREGLSLWRGPPLEDVAVDSFPRAEIGALDDRRLAAHEDLFEAELAFGHHAEVLPELERLARGNPLRERLQAQLMLALYRSGRQADALEAYRNARRHFADELGIEPGPELRELEQAILRQDPSLAPNGAPGTAPSSAVRQRPSKRAIVGLSVAIAAVLGGILGAVLALGGGSTSLSAIPPNSVGEIDPASGKITRAVPVGAGPIGLAVAGRRLWVASLESRTISRIDPATGKLVDVVSTGGSPTAIAAGPGAVWVADGFAGKLVRLDPTTGQVTNSVPLGGHPSAVVVDRNGIWVANSVLDAVQHIDPATLDVHSIPVGSEPDALTIGAGSVWVANSLGRTLTRIDSATGRVLERAIPLLSTPAGLSFGGGSLWVAEPQSGTLTRINPGTSHAQASIHLGGTPNALLVVGNTVWLADASNHLLQTFDPRSSRITRRITVGSAPQALAAPTQKLWVAAGQS